MLLDGLIVGVPLGILNGVLDAAFGSKRVVATSRGLVTTHTLHGGAEIALLLILAAIGASYFAFLNGTGTGQTLGNRAPGIAVRDVDSGEAIGFWRGLLRWFVRSVLYLAFVIPGLINDLFPLWDRQHQTLADKAARSVVIRTK